MVRLEDGAALLTWGFWRFGRSLKRRRGDGGVSARVVWRLGGTRGAAYQAETFTAGSNAQNLARADGFKKMVDAAGQRWPDGWVRVKASSARRARPTR